MEVSSRGGSLEGIPIVPLTERQVKPLEEAVDTQKMVAQVRKLPKYIPKSPVAHPEKAEGVVPIKPAWVKTKVVVDHKTQNEAIDTLQQHLVVATENMKKKLSPSKAAELIRDFGERVSELQKNRELRNWTEEVESLLEKIDMYVGVENKLMENTLRAVFSLSDNFSQEFQKPLTEKITTLLMEKYGSLSNLSKNIASGSVLQFLQAQKGRDGKPLMREGHALLMFKLLKSEVPNLADIEKLRKELGREELFEARQVKISKQRGKDLSTLMKQGKIAVQVNPSAAVPRIFKHVDSKTGLGIYKDSGEIDRSKIPLLALIKRTGELAFKGMLGIFRPTNFLAGERPEAKACAEVASYDFAEYFGFNANKAHPLVPKTTFIHEPGKVGGAKGTFQEFVQGYLLANEKQIDKEGQILFDPVNPPFDVDSLSDDEKLIFLKFIMFDFLIGNLDRHDANWMLKFEMRNGKPTLAGIAAIDNGNGFPVKLPEDTTGNSRVRQRQYEWAIHALGKMNLTPSLIKKLQEWDSENEITDELKIKSAFIKERNKFVASRDAAISGFAHKFCCKEIQDTYLLRAKGLEAWLYSDNPTVGSLAALKSAEEINAFLMENALHAIFSSQKEFPETVTEQVTKLLVKKYGNLNTLRENIASMPQFLQTPVKEGEPPLLTSEQALAMSKLLENAIQSFKT